MGYGPAGNTSASPDGNRGSKPDQGQPPERPDGYVVGQLEQGCWWRPSSSASAAAGQPGRLLRPGEWEPTPDRPAAKKPMTSPMKTTIPSSKRSKSPGFRTGSRLGVSRPGRGSVGVTRPIRIECYGDRLVVVSERSPEPTK